MKQTNPLIRSPLIRSFPGLIPKVRCHHGLGEEVQRGAFLARRLGVEKPKGFFAWFGFSVVGGWGFLGMVCGGLVRFEKLVEGLVRCEFVRGVGWIFHL